MTRNHETISSFDPFVLAQEIHWTPLSLSPEELSPLWRKASDDVSISTISSEEVSGTAMLTV